MKSPLCETLGIEFPLFAFSHCRDVVAARTHVDSAALGLVQYLDAAVHPLSLEVPDGIGVVGDKFL